MFSGHVRHPQLPPSKAIPYHPELTEWMAYYQLEPFGESWFQTGTIAAAVANAAMFREGDPFKPSDFMPTDPEATGDSEEGAKRRLVSRMMREHVKRRQPVR